MIEKCIEFGAEYLELRLTKEQCFNLVERISRETKYTSVCREIVTHVEETEVDYSITDDIQGQRDGVAGQRLKKDKEAPRKSVHADKREIVGEFFGRTLYSADPSYCCHFSPLIVNFVFNNINNVHRLFHYTCGEIYESLTVKLEKDRMKTIDADCSDRAKRRIELANEMHIEMFNKIYDVASKLRDEAYNKELAAQPAPLPF
jgi:hypothetical protein